MNVWLMGGFGNVLFQILAYRYTKTHTDNVKYVTLLTKKNIITKILGWTIHEELYNNMIDDREIKDISVIDSIIPLIFLFLNKTFNYNNNISQFYSMRNKIKSPYAKNIFGYFQDKYFLQKNQANILHLGNEIYKQYKMNESHIIVHYRMGDSDWAKEQNNYYTKIKEIIKKEKNEVLIATDSPQDALRFFSDCTNIKLTGAKSAIDDFKYMVSASKLYCAPSTFSWWACHASPKTTQVVVPAFLNDTLGFYIESDRLLIV